MVELPARIKSDESGLDAGPLKGLAILLLGKKWEAVIAGDSRKGWARLTRALSLQFIPRGVLVVGSSTLALVVAVLAGIYAKEIYENTGQLLPRLPLLEWVTPRTLVAGFWIGCFVAIWLIFARVIEQKWATEELNLKAYRILEPTFHSLEETLNAARHFASPALFSTHDRHFAELHEVVRAALDEGTPEALGKAIRTGLQMVATMASRYARAPDTASYGANVMLVATGDYPQKLLDRLIFLGGHRNNGTTEFYKFATAACGSVLYLPRDLLVSNLEKRATREIPDIALPVPQPDGEGANPDVIPGAPFALFHGRVSVHRDTHTIADEYARFAQAVRDEIRVYFTTGAGRDVRSFASFRIGTADEPVGVLNIDSNAVNVLGTYDDSAAMTTFLSLLTPVRLILREPISRYAALTYADRFR
jgi:hypothetical protein